MRLTYRLLIVALSAMMIAVGFSSPAHAADTLKYGSSGPDVMTLQRLLDTNIRADFFNYPDYTDRFLSVTETGLKSWELAAGLRPNGRIAVGGRHWQKLVSEVRPPDLDARAVRASKRHGVAIDISKTDRKARLLKDGRIVLEADARFGGWTTDEDGKKVYLPTREGAFSVFRKGGAEYRSNLYSVENEGVLMPYPTFFSGGQAVHYSYEFAKVGYAVFSHGCVGLRDMAAAERFNKVPYGTVVVVHR